MASLMPLIATVLLFALHGCSANTPDRVRLEGDQHLAGQNTEWKAVGPAPISARHKLVFALSQRNVGELERTLMAVSTPGNPRYGKFLSAEQVDRLVQPDAASVQSVVEWLERDAGVSVARDCEFTRAREFLDCDMSIEQASALLAVRFQEYESAGVKAMRAAGHYTVPTRVAEHLDFVGGAHRLPVEQHRLRPNSTQYRLAKAHGMLSQTPSSLREQYGVGSAVGTGTDDKNMQSVAQFLDQHYLKEDLEKFMEKYGTDFKHMSEVAKEVGPNLGRAGIEASLDIEYIMALGANIPTWFWSTSGRHEGQEPFLLWIQAVANTTTIPNVISVSYGDDEDTLSAIYMQRVGAEFQKLGVRGVSILFASGDDGAGCHKAIFRPNFPATSPYVTAVGGTYQTADGEVGVSFSSGGFSNVFAQTSYQATGVKHFLETSEHLPEERLYNKSGRGYPDVSALSTDFIVISNGFSTPADGTSCAAPTFSGVVSLVNDKLINEHGKTALGFLNPFLYETGYHGLTDITSGCNEGCSGHGFCAQAGWDPVTGLGTPKFTSLLEEALKAKSLH